MHLRRIRNEVGADLGMGLCGRGVRRGSRSCRERPPGGRAREIQREPRRSTRSWPSRRRTWSVSAFGGRIPSVDLLLREERGFIVNLSLFVWNEVRGGVDGLEIPLKVDGVVVTHGKRKCGQPLGRTSE